MGFNSGFKGLITNHHLHAIFLLPSYVKENIVSCVFDGCRRSCKIMAQVSKANASYHEEPCNFYGDFRNKTQSINTESYILL